MIAEIVAAQTRPDSLYAIAGDVNRFAELGVPAGSST
jgi:hypothetical protein